MAAVSGLIRVMEKAARKAGGRLRRDFGEVEHLQVSRKGPSDFVSKADQAAERTLWDEKPISVALPSQIEATIVEADAVVKGQTASSSYKPAVLDNGVRILVPPHIGTGTRIVVDVYEQAYVGKAG